jgi:prolyl-tRNA synthetase
MYKIWVRSHADLPLKLYQVVNTFRYETKHTRPLIRLREITSFKEAHTVHATWEDAEVQVREAIELYTEIYRRLGIPVLRSRRPDWDKFPGADYTDALDAVMPDGKTLQIGTVHHLGDNFAKTFNIKYEAPDGEQCYAHQTCYGISERSIAAIISIHGDDKGLVLPPEIAPVQVVIIPIIFKKGGDDVLAVCKDVQKRLKKIGIRVEIDASDLRPGAKYYKWEMKGVPLRLEIGPRDLEKNIAVAVRRDTGNKEHISLSDIEADVISRFESIHKNLYDKAKIGLLNRIFNCTNFEEVKDKIQKGIATIPWCGKKECGLIMEDQINAGILGIPLEQKKDWKEKCPVCKEETQTLVYVARTY